MFKELGVDNIQYLDWKEIVSNQLQIEDDLGVIDIEANEALEELENRKVMHNNNDAASACGALLGVVTHQITAVRNRF